MTDAELDALVKRLGNVSLQTGFPSRTTIDSDVIREAADAITTLRAQLADALEINEELHATAAIAEDYAHRAEAERAAQIEEIGFARLLVDTGWSEHDGDNFTYHRSVVLKLLGILDKVLSHDRTALDRYRETVLREAADELKGQGYNTAVRQILALIEK